MAQAETAQTTTEKPAASPAGKKTAPDIATIAGIVLSLGAILGGLLLEGGKIGDLAQYTAAMIVLGGTLGAVMVSTPLKVLLGAAKRLVHVFLDATPQMDVLVDEVVGYAVAARKTGIAALEHKAEQIADPFFRKALMSAVDGMDLNDIKSMLELDISLAEQHSEAEAKVFESAGGYAPTVGIIGAVLGLIQVMKNLANIDEVGHGIAVSFVATVYGVGFANLFFLPAAAKIKARAQAETHRREMILEGVAAIAEGLNPKVVRIRLESFLQGAKPPKAEKEAAAGATAPVGA